MNRSAQIERLFLGVGLVAGVAFALVFPPFTVSDEPAHFFRAFHVSAGRLVPEQSADGLGGVLPASLPRLFDDLSSDLPLHPERKADAGLVLGALGRPLGSDTRFVSFRDAAFASPLPYAPQAAAIALGRWLGAPPLALFYLARLANLAVSTAIMWWALRLLPTRRWLIVLFALTPMATSLRGSLSADASTIALAFLLTALVARWTWGSSSVIETRDHAVLVATAAALCLTKLPYALLVTLVLLIPAERFRPGERRRRLTWLLATVLAALAVSAWYAYHANVSPRPGTLPFQQIRDALLEPGRFALLLAGDAVAHTPRYLAQLVGAQLGWVDTRVPWTLVYVYFVVLGALTVLDADPGRMPDRRARWVLGGVVAATVVAVAASQYATWTSYRAEVIEGIQGRYFLPVAPAAALLLQFRRGAGRIDLERYRAWLTAFIVIGLLVALAAVVRRYYV